MVLNPKLSQSVMSWCLETALVLIFSAVENVGDRLNHSKLKQYLSQYNDDYNFSGKQMNRMLYDLKRREYLDFGEGDSVKLTDKARIKIIDKICERNRSDDKYRLVSFDIPETKRTGRNNFRRAIKRMGFKQVQKSLWVTSRNIGEFVDIVAKEYKVSDYVAYIIADHTNIDKFLAKKLKD